MPDEQSLIQDLREIEKDFREKGEYRKANIIDLFIIQSTHCKIPREKITNKINTIKEDKESYYYDKFLEERDIEITVQILQELLQKSEDK